MRLPQRARSTYALSLILCAVLLGALAVPAMAANGTSRADGAASQSQAEARKEQAKEKKEAARARRAEAAKSSSESSSASSQGQSSSAAKSSNASAKGQSASGAKSDNASSKTNGSAATAAKAEKSAKAEKPAKAEAQDEAKAGENSPAGNKGSLKVRPVGTAAQPPRNYAHLPCVVQVDFYGSPHSGATLTAVSQAPTSPTGQTLLTKTMSFSQSSPNPRGNELVGTTTLDFTSVVSGLTYHEQQGYHVKLTAVQDGPQGGDVKHEVFWIDCVPPAPTADESAAVAESQVEVEPENAKAEVQGVSDSVDTQVAGKTVERGEAVAAAEGRVLGTSGAVAPRNNAKVLAATGMGVLALTLLGLAGLGGGAGILRRFRKS